MSKSLQGKIALVTGGSRGIGAAIALALAQEGAGVAIGYARDDQSARSVVARLEALGVRAVAFKADQADAAQVARLVGDVAAKFGQLDILVNNAGVFHVGAVDAAVDTAAFDRQFAVNVHGVVAAIRAASRVMKEGGRIISISSAAATRAGAGGLADYAATKGAIEAYSKSAARDLGPRKITVNVIAVGPVETDMNPDSGPFAALLKSGTALGRYGQPAEIAAAALFLASPGASFVTGSVLTADGGLNA